MRQRTLLHALPQPHLCCTLLFSTTTSSRTSPYTSSTSFSIKQKNAQKLSCHKTKPYLCTHKTKTTVPLVKSRQVFPQGEMVEWSITTVLKTVVPRGTGGSNPSLSAKVSATSCETQVALIFRLMVRQICARIFQVIEQTSLIHLAVLLVIAKHDKTKKRHKRTLWGKSDWEKTCDDGGKFFGW